LSNGGLHRRTPPNRDTRAPEVCPVFILPRIPYPGCVTDIFARFTLFYVIHRHRYICSVPSDRLLVPLDRFDSKQNFFHTIVRETIQVKTHTMHPPVPLATHLVPCCWGTQALPRHGDSPSPKEPNLSTAPDGMVSDGLGKLHHHVWRMCYTHDPRRPTSSVTALPILPRGSQQQSQFSCYGGLSQYEQEFDSLLAPFRSLIPSFST